MNHRLDDHSREQDFFIHFPIGKLSGWLFLLLIGIMVAYRFSEAAGQSVKDACLSAIAVSLLAAVAGVIPIYKVWGKDLMWVGLGVFLSGVIRLLIGFVGVVIIILFTGIDRIRFIAFLALFYIAFLAIDTWLAVWVLRHTRIDTDAEQETVIHGNLWDIVGRGRRSA